MNSDDSTLRELLSIVREVTAPAPPTPVIEVRIVVKLEGDEGEEDEGDDQGDSPPPGVHPPRPVRRGCGVRKPRDRRPETGRH